MAKTTKQRPQPDHLEELFHELRTTRKGGQRAPRAIWLPVVFLLTFAGLGLFAVGAYFGGTHLFGLNEDAELGISPDVAISDLGPAPEIGEIAEWAILDAHAPSTSVTVIQVWRDTSCPGCLTHARLLNKAHFETDRVFDPLWIFSTADPAADFVVAAQRAADAEVDWAVGWDPTGRVAEAFPGDAVVSTYIVDDENRLRYATDGAPQDIQLNRLILELTGNQPAETP